MPTGIYNRQNTKTPIYTLERNRKISEAMKGKKLSEEHRRKLSQSHKGKPSSRGFLGKHHSEETKIKMSDIKKGKTFSEESKNKMKLAAKERWQIPGYREKIKESHMGEKNHQWQGGKSFEPYSVDWIDDLKRAIRKRDKYICQICGGEPAIYVHHIDYNKKNCNPDNLITLCQRCHLKTNHNRNYWQNYFINLTNQ